MAEEKTKTKPAQIICTALIAYPDYKLGELTVEPIVEFGNDFKQVLISIIKKISEFFSKHLFAKFDCFEVEIDGRSYLFE